MPLTFNFKVEQKNHGRIEVNFIDCIRLFDTYILNPSTALYQTSEETYRLTLADGLAIN